MDRIFVFLALSMISHLAAGNELTKSAIEKYRQATIHLNISKTTETGEVLYEEGTGFVVTKSGHVITSCHVIDKTARNDDGDLLAIQIDKVVARGATASKSAQDEEMSIIGCAQPGIDIGLLKFKNTSFQRQTVKIHSRQPQIGDELTSLGFPLGSEFFARSGTVSSEFDNDTLLVSMVMNPGDSGAPVFDSSLHVTAIAEAGYGDKTGIGIVRPIRHAAMLLAIAGIDIFAVDANIQTTEPSNSSKKNDILEANPKDALIAFSKGIQAIPTGNSNITVTYPIYKIYPNNIFSPNNHFDLASATAQPGYKITDAKFIVTERSGVNILHVGASPDGTAARAALQPASPSVLLKSNNYVKGYLSTTQQRLD